MVQVKMKERKGKKIPNQLNIETISLVSVSPLPSDDVLVIASYRLENVLTG